MVSVIMVFNWRDEYFFSIFILGSIFFLIVSYILGGRIPLRVAHDPNHRRTSRLIFGYGIAAWILTLLFVSLLNLTPLCIGHDSEDGTNSFNSCILLTGSVILFYSPCVVLLAAAATISLRGIFSKWLGD
jgi:hypothetical protein